MSPTAALPLPRPVSALDAASAAPHRPRIRHIHDACWSGRYRSCPACVAEAEAEAEVSAIALLSQAEPAPR
jgi:hypothetical protein